MRKKIVAGNWKMNKTFSEAEDLLNEISEELEEISHPNIKVIVCPPSPYLEMATDLAQELDFFVGAQNVSEYPKGAYTGEISAAMLQSMSVDFCIVGHSERRIYFNETHKQISQKIEQLLQHTIIPIFCCGEQLAEREASKHFETVRTQIEESLFMFEPLDFTKIVIAYEPVWAIGTGKTATANEAQEMHAYIRSLVAEKYGKEVARNTSILYGGSCNAHNSAELFSQPDVDGGLIGGASLLAADFAKIVDSF